MGSYQSNIVKSTIDIINSTIVSTEQKVRVDMKQTCSTGQTINLVIGERAVVGNVNLIQRNQTVCNFDGNGTAALSTEIVNEVTNKIDEALKQVNDATVDFLALSVTGGTNKSVLQTELKNIFEVAVKQSFEGTCSQNLLALQNLQVLIEGKVGNLNVDQNIQATAIASCILQAVSDQVADNTQLNDIIKKIDMLNKSSQSGISDLFNIWTLLIVLGVLALLGGGMYIFSSGKKTKRRR
jgi:hypothetical protein